MLSVEVIEMLCLLHGGVCDDFGCEPGGIPATCAWGSLGLL